MSEQVKVIQVPEGSLITADEVKAAEKIGYERGFADAKKNELPAALIQAQSEFEHIKMNKKMTITWGNQNREYNYADLSAIIAAVRPALNRNGLAIYHDIVTDGNKCTATPVLLHKSGERLIGAPVTITAKDTNPHSIGSAITYAKRYSMTALLNIAAEDDDDGTGAMTDPMNQDPTGKPPKPQGATKTSGATKTPSKPEAPKEPAMSAPQEQLGGTTQTQGMTDAQRVAAGLINQTQFKELKTLLETKGIDAKKWKSWLMRVFKYNGISEIEVKNFEAIKEIVNKHPEQIMNPQAKSREPGVDD